MTEMAKNPWIPAPLFVNKEEEEKNEKINEDIPINQVILQLDKFTHSSANESYLQLIFELSNDKSVSENIKTDSGLKYSKMFKLEKSEFNYLHRRTLKLVIFEKTGFCCFKKDLPIAEIVIKLDFVKKISEYQKTVNFVSNNKDVSKSTVSVTVKIRNSLDKNEFVIKSKTSIAITKTFPPFKGVAVEGLIDEEEKPRNINKDIQKAVRKPTINKNQTDNSNSQAKMPELKVQYQMSDFKQEELTNPDYIDNLVSIKVLNFKIEKVNKEIQNIEGRAPQNLREKLVKMKVKKNVLII
jgi:hypothetical protein